MNTQEWQSIYQRHSARGYPLRACTCSLLRLSYINILWVDDGSFPNVVPLWVLVRNWIYLWP